MKNESEPVGFYIEKDGLTGAKHKAQLDQFFFSAKGLDAIYCLEIILNEQIIHILQTRKKKYSNKRCFLLVKTFQKFTTIIIWIHDVRKSGFKFLFLLL